jgi:hypothetical protein
MKNLFLILVTLAIIISCKKKESVLNTTVYCMYSGYTSANVFIGCGSKSDMQKKAVQVRDEGKEFRAIEKSSCSECQ